MSNPENPLELSKELKESLRDMEQHTGHPMPDVLARAIDVLNYQEQQEVTVTEERNKGGN